MLGRSAVEEARMTRPLAVALIGQQFMGRAHSNAWGQAGRFFEGDRRPLLHAVAARDAASLPAFAERWGWSRWTDDWRTLADDPAVELVDVATPNHLHREQALAMLSAGKHVACEKPLAGTLADARAMRDAALRAKRRGTQTFVWFNYRRCPAVGLAYHLIREGRLGAVRHVRALYLQSWGGPDTPRSWRFQRKLAGSGAHGDLNAHMIDLARFLTGEEITVVHGAAARTFIARRPLPDEGGAGVGKRGAPGRRGGRQGRQRRSGRSDVDDSLAFLAGLSGGGLASFEATRLAPGHLNDNRIEINGERGSLAFAFEDMNVLWLHDAPEGARTAGWRRIVATDVTHPYVARWWPEGHVLGYEHGFVNMAADILAALSGREPALPLPDFEDAWRTQRVLEAAARAAAAGRAVGLGAVR
jgi:predicted dehydrogenase